MWKPNLIRSQRYTLHGPSSTIMVWSQPRRLVYAANFAAQIPAVILSRVESDERENFSPDALARLIALAETDMSHCDSAS